MFFSVRTFGHSFRSIIILLRCGYLHRAYVSLVDPRRRLHRHEIMSAINYTSLLMLRTFELIAFTSVAFFLLKVLWLFAQAYLLD